MKLLIDMNLSPTWVSFFAAHNISSIHWSKVSKPDAPDVEIFEYAQQNDFIVFTNDLDFGAILAATNANAPSVFQLKSQELMPHLVGNQVVQCLNQYQNYLLNGSLITFDTSRTRLRILPLR
jgi:predicted nuclease of predicted toxin-antitoxin system